MSNFHTNIAIIGAGVVGLAIAKTLSDENEETLILEELHEFINISNVLCPNFNFIYILLFE